METFNGLEKNLRAAVSVIELIYRRNKNQHRRSLWFRWLAILRRNLFKVILDNPNASPKILRMRLDFVEQAIVPQCYRCGTLSFKMNRAGILKIRRS